MADIPKTITLAFDGYWREPKMSSLPRKLASTASTRAPTTRTPSQAHGVDRQAGVHRRVRRHSRACDQPPASPTWKKQLAAGQVLCFSAAKVAVEADRQQAEAALIFKHKPPANDEYTTAFTGFETTTINATGETAKLTTTFTVKEDAQGLKPPVAGGVSFGRILLKKIMSMIFAVGYRSRESSPVAKSSVNTSWASITARLSSKPSPSSGGLTRIGCAAESDPEVTDLRSPVFEFLV